MKRYSKLIVIPVVIIVVCLYLIGINIISRVDKIDDAEISSVYSDYKTEQQENEELEAITDKININTATESELMLIDGIGEVRAKSIIAARDELGGFDSTEQLREIKEIGDKLYEKIKDYITVD